MNLAYISLDPIMESYLRKMFNCTTGVVRISERNPVGAIISRLVRKGNVRYNPDENEIPLAIPDGERRRHLENYHLYFLEVDKSTITKVLRAFYEIELRSIVVTGAELGLNRKQSLLAFTEEFGDRVEAVNFEQANRYLSRERLRQREMLRNYMKRNSIHSQLSVNE